MMQRIWMVLCAVLIVACNEVQAPKIYYVTPDPSGVVKIPLDSGVEVDLDFGSIGGQSIAVHNTNDRMVGVYITHQGASGALESTLFSQDFLLARSSNTKTGVYFERGWEIAILVVTYRDLGSAFQALFDQSPDKTVEHRFYTTVVIGGGNPSSQ